MGIEPLSEPDDPIDLRRSLDRVGAWLGSARPDALVTLTGSWETLVGRRLASHTDLESFHDGVAVVTTSEPAVAEQVGWAARDLVAAMNAVLGRDEVTAVKVRVRPR